MELLERGDALAVLDSALADASAGRGCVVLVAGEAGIGKTSAVREFARRHGSSATFHWGSCDALTMPRPLGPLYDIARSAGGEFGAVMRSDASTDERLSAFLDALAGSRLPVVAVVEDAHWADDATRDALIFVARRIAAMRAMLVVTYRDDEVDALHPLRATLGHLATLGTARRVDLVGLSQEGVATLIGTGADAAAVHSLTQGNPFFVAEIANSRGQGLQGIPRTVSDAVLARAAQLSADARAVLEVAAIASHGLDPASLAAVARVPAASVDECIRFGLLAVSGRVVLFRHEIARRAIADGVPAARAQEVHAAVLARLSAQTGQDPARLAHHAAGAGDRDAVIRLSAQAGDTAANLGSPREAMAQYSRALEWGTEPSDERTGLLIRYSDTCFAMDHYDQGIAALEEARAHYREQGDTLGEGDALRRLSEFHWCPGRIAEARACAEDAVEMLSAAPPSWQLANAQISLAARCASDDRRDEAALWAQRALDLAKGLGAPTVALSARSLLGVVTFSTDGGQALESVIEEGVRTGNPGIAAAAYFDLGLKAVENKNSDIVVRLLPEGIALCTDHGFELVRQYLVAFSARTALNRGVWAEAVDGASAVIAQPRTSTTPRIFALVTLGLVRCRSGHGSASEPLHEAWALAQPTGEIRRMGPVATALAEAAWLRGDAAGVDAATRDTLPLAIDRRASFHAGELAVWRMRAGLAEIPVPRDVLPEPCRLSLEGRHLEAAEAWDALDCPYEAAVALVDSEDPVLLALALERCARLDARPLGDRVAAVLRAAGAHDIPRRPSRRTAENPAHLTDRELEVLYLVVAGQTTPQIASTLFISPKTAGHHVAAIFDKLGVHSRRDAVAAADNLGLVAP